ncbi:myb-related protein 306-like [Impatiens glandulifera]|uniref:myb-related protein 306-like n=1 Tax=Impatiens glandulifera TaxID=253017 RepID=UPI001FB0833C|nr:myb-related protein 306-like [Impatiens glandulifera]
MSNKGRWERRLQTDIHKAKQALSEALSLHNQPSSSTQEPIILLSSPPPSPSPPLASSYLTSAENIAKLLPNWMKKKNKNDPPSLSQTSSDATAHSSVNSHGKWSNPSEQEAGFGSNHKYSYSYSYSRFNSSSSCDGDDRDHDHDQTAANYDGERSHQQVSLLPTEKWFLDHHHDGGTDGHDLLMGEMSFGETNHGLFESFK